MQRILKFLALFVFLFVLGIVAVKADVAEEDKIVCDQYDGLNLKLTYYKRTDEIRYEFEYDGKKYDTNYTTTGNKHNFYIAKWGKSIDADIQYDAKILKSLKDQNLCPTAIHIGAYSKWSANFPSVWSLISWLDVFVSHNLDRIKNDGYSILNFGAGYIYIMTEESYEDKYEQYEGGVLEGMLITNLIKYYKEGKNAWKSIPIVGKLDSIGVVAGVVTAAVGGPLEEFWDMLTESGGYRVASYEVVEDFGIARYGGSYATFNVNCPTLSTSFLLYRQTIGEYSACNNGTCKQNKKNELNKIQSNLQLYCNTILKTKSYTDAEKDCLLDCLNMTETLNSYKKGTDLYNDKMYKGDTCGLPAQLIIWIENILRWVKYLIPVVLIALSILDFIKALASEKEDEMKKAQKHFVTRLIAAALIFIMPVILEFVMGKMGFTAERCGIDNIGF